MPTRSRRRLALATILAGLGLAAAAAPALAQSRTGPFLAFNSWWVGEGGVLGIFYDGSRVRIDRDGDGTAESLFLPSGIPAAAIGSLRLTPSREIVYAFGGTCASTGTLVHFYRVPPTGDRLDPIRTDLCIPGGILQPPRFYDTGICDSPDGIVLDCFDPVGMPLLGVSPQRIAAFVTAASSPLLVRIVWVDLRSGASTTATAFDYQSGIGFIHVSPSGTLAIVQHDLPVPAETDYTLVNLCPGSLGQVLNPGGFPISNEPGDPPATPLEAEVLAVASGMVTVAVSTQSGDERTRFDLTDCLDAPGACCYDSGFCTDTSVQQSCDTSGGDWLGEGASCDDCPAPPDNRACCFAVGFPVCEVLEVSACAAQGGDAQQGTFCGFDTCPVEDPAISGSGPATAGPGDEITYVFDYENRGGRAASAAVIEMQLPFGTTFVAASAGGVEDQGIVRWQLGSLAAGASGSVSLTLRMGCESGGVFLNYLFGWDVGGGISYIGGPPVITDFVPLPGGAVTLAASTIPDVSPLGAGDGQRHTIVLTNTTSEARPGIFLASPGAPGFPGIGVGDAAGFDAVLDDGGGSLASTGDLVTWTGDLAPGGTATIEFTTRIDTCIPPEVEETQLNEGTAIAAFDACNDEVGQTPAPGPVPIEQQVEATLAAENLPPPARIISPIADYGAQLTRPGALARVQIKLRSRTGGSFSAAALSLGIDGLALSSSPLVSPTAPGTTYDPVDRSVTWNGTIPASGDVTITFEGTLQECRARLYLEGSSGPGCTDVREEAYVAAVPLPPVGPYLAANAFGIEPTFGGFEGQVFSIDLADPDTLRPQLCLPSEFGGTLATAPNGDIWVGWLPTYRYNPITLTIAGLDWRRHGAAGLNSLSDIAVDPRDGTTYLVGSGYDGIESRAVILRYLPASDALTLLHREPSLAYFDHAQVDGQGRIVATAADPLAQRRVVRIDPAASPPSVEAIAEPGASFPSALAIDTDGSYLVMDTVFSQTPALADIDATTLDAEPVVADLKTLVGGSFGFDDLAVDDTGVIWITPPQRGLARIDREPSLTASVVIPFSFNPLGQINEIELAVPEPGSGLQILAALAALTALTLLSTRHR